MTTSPSDDTRAGDDETWTPVAEKTLAVANTPIPSNFAEVARVLREMADFVEAGDSFEGSIEYLLPEVPEWAQRNEPKPEGWEDAEVMLRAAYRIGNRDHGQGSLRILGSITGA